MRSFLTHFLRSSDGGSAAELALVMPVLTLFLVGIIDVGRLMWTWNQAEKATQVGVRTAVVNDFVPSSLATRDFAVQDSVPGGQAVPSSAFSTTLCQSGSCSNGWGYSATAFTFIVNQMKTIMPQITAANVEVKYDNVGLGFAGDPNGPDVAPLVTVRLKNVTFQPAMSALFGGTYVLPGFSAALTMEDGNSA